MSEHKKPGVMIYFDVAAAMEPLNYTDKGRLFQAIMNYAQYGEVPELPQKLRTLWPLLTSRMDLDSARSQRTVIHRKYAAYRRWEQHKFREPLPLVEWMLQEGYGEMIRQSDYDASA